MNGKRYIYEVSGNRETMMGGGEVIEIIGYIGRQIQIVHERMKKQDVRAAAAFRAAVIAMVLDQESLIWTSDDRTEGVSEDCFVMRDGKGGGVDCARSE